MKSVKSYAVIRTAYTVFTITVDDRKYVGITTQPMNKYIRWFIYSPHYKVLYNTRNRKLLGKAIINEMRGGFVHAKISDFIEKYVSVIGSFDRSYDAIRKASMLQDKYEQEHWTMVSKAPGTYMARMPMYDNTEITYIQSKLADNMSSCEVRHIAKMFGNRISGWMPGIKIKMKRRNLCKK